MQVVVRGRVPPLPSPPPPPRSFSTLLRQLIHGTLQPKPNIARRRPTKTRSRKTARRALESRRTYAFLPPNLGDVNFGAGRECRECEFGAAADTCRHGR